MTAIRATARSVLDDGRLLGVSGAVVAGEVLVRVALTWGFSSLWLVAWPPIIAATAFGRNAASGRSDTSGAFAGRIRRTGMVTLVAVAGHAVALVAGAALFFAIDTPLRAFVYWVGLDPMAWPFAYLGLPLVGLALCTAVVWVVPATIIADIARGTPAKTAVPRTLRAIISERSFFDWLAFVYMLVAACVAVAMVVSSYLLIITDVFPLNVPRYTSFGADTASFVLYYLVAIVLAAALATVPLALGAQLTRNGASRLDGLEYPEATADSGLDRHRPVLTVVIVALLVVSLITVFGGVRMAELRPVEDPEPESLTDHHRLMVLEALDNLRSHSYVVYKYDLQDSPETGEMVAGIDPQTREVLLGELVLFSGSESIYLWPGHAYIGPKSPTEAVIGDHPDDERRSVPGHNLNVFRNAQTRFPYYFPYHHTGSTDDATVEYEDEVIRVNTSDSELVVSDAVGIPASADEIQTGWLEVVIDRETKTPRQFEYRYEIESDDREDRSEHVRYEIDLDASVQRPEDAPGPSLEERVWRVLLY